VKATEVTAGLAESNGSLLPGLWRDSLHVTCGLTACTPGSAPGPTLGNEYGKTLPFYLLHCHWVFCLRCPMHSRRTRVYVSVELPSVRPSVCSSVCLSHRSTASSNGAKPAGFLLSRRYRPDAPAGAVLRAPTLSSKCG